MHPLSCADRASHPAVCSPQLPLGQTEILVFWPKEVCAVWPTARQVGFWWLGGGLKGGFLPGGWEPWFSVTSKGFISLLFQVVYRGA